MSDALEIRSGGAVHVDTESLRAAHAAASALAAAVREVQADLVAATRKAAGAEGELSGRDALWSVSGSLSLAAAAAARLADDLSSLAVDLGSAADLYELVELQVRWRLAVGAGADAEAAAVASRSRDLGARLWGAGFGSSAELVFARVRFEASRSQFGLTSDLLTQAYGGGLLLGGAGVLGAAGFAVGGAGALLGIAGVLSGWRSKRRPGDFLTAPSPIAPGSSQSSVAVVTRRSAAAPRGLAAAARRVPGGGRARVRVERYDMPGGSREWVVYVAGTQSFDLAPLGWAGADPFDMTSNLQLYTGGASASYDALVEALRAEGVAPGEPVHTVAHSQGALVTHAVAASTQAEVRTVITFGSPAASAVAPDVLSVDVRHSDDVVAALSGPVREEVVGAPGSIVVQRLADPSPGLHDLANPAHDMERYVETAALIDRSPDPRTRAVDALLAHLGSAERVTATEYSAKRTKPGSSSADVE